VSCMVLGIARILGSHVTKSVEAKRRCDDETKPPQLVNKMQDI